MTDAVTSDATLITGTETTSPSEVSRTRTIDEVVDDWGLLRSQARLLGHDVAETGRRVGESHQRAVALQLDTRARRNAKRDAGEMLSELADAGFSWRDIAALVGVSVPAVRRWRLGESPTAQNRLAIGRLVALIETLRDEHMVSGVASWMEMPIAVGAPVTAIDLVVAGREVDVVDLAAEHTTGEDVLDHWQPDWRERYRSDYEVFEASDGELATRPITGESP